MKKFKKIIFKSLVFVLAISLNSCTPKEKELLIKDGDYLEYRANYPGNNFFEKLIIIEPTTQNFLKIQKFVNSLNNLKEIKKIKETAFYSITASNLKVLIGNDNVYILQESFNNTFKILKQNIPNCSSRFSSLLSINSDDWIYDLGKMYGKGEFKQSNYTFCGFVGTEKQYEYKTGHWKFWNFKKELVAEGKFINKEKTIHGHGGCPYSIITSKIDNNWILYSTNEKIDKVSLVSNIENAKRLTAFSGF